MWVRQVKAVAILAIWHLVVGSATLYRAQAACDDNCVSAAACGGGCTSTSGCASPGCTAADETSLTPCMCHACRRRSAARCATSTCAPSSCAAASCESLWGCDRGCGAVYLQGDALWLQRDAPANSVMASDVDSQGLGFGTRSFRLSSFSNFDLQPGFRTTIGYRLGCCSALEGTYFGMNYWSSAAPYFPDIAGGATSAQSPFLGSSIPFTDQGFNTSLYGRYASELQNGEINLRFWMFRNALGQMSLLTGVRYLSWREELELRGQDINSGVQRIETTKTRTFNNLIGWQCGGEFRRNVLGGLASIGANGKAGIYGNAAALRLTNEYAGPVSGTALDFARTGSNTSVVFDASLFTTVHVTSNVTIRGGYQILYLSGIALAPDNLRATGTTIRDSDVLGGNPPTITSRFNRDGDMFLHGPFVGGEWRY